MMIKGNKMYGSNPIMGLDYPDVDVIRVEDTYYMVSTTMYFMPGGVILRSYDLLNWEIASYVYETLDDTESQQLKGEQNIYGKGMWAASLRHHKGIFYVCFVANDTHKTYLFQSTHIEGPWKKQTIKGFYHDCSLLFDDDDKVYMIYGNKTIYLTELNVELTEPKVNGLNRVIVEDTGHKGLGYEGAHFYKINGRYYAFFIHSLRNCWFRTEACFSSDSLLGEFTGGDVFQDDMQYRNAGVAQGGIVDTPEGKWYAILFQDRGAVGRLPVIVPLHWEDNQPVLGVEGKVPIQLELISTRPDYVYDPLYTSDEFNYVPDAKGKVTLNKVWQWNHNPHLKYWSVTECPSALRLHSGKICDNLLQAYNTLTQRTAESISSAEITVDGSAMKNGDFAGICALLGCYGAVALMCEDDTYSIVMQGKAPSDGSLYQNDGDMSRETATVYEKVAWDMPYVSLKVCVDYRNEVDEATFYYKHDSKWIPIGKPHKLIFKMDLFTGCRFGLYYYSTQEIGGWTDFKHFIYNRE